VVIERHDLGEGIGSQALQGDGCGGDDALWTCQSDDGFANGVEDAFGLQTHHRIADAALPPVWR
jgi:hypothetical protein